MIIPTKEILEKLVIEGLPLLKEVRQHLHTYPELAYKEFETAKYIREKLKEFGYELIPPFIETDTVVFLNKGKPGKNVTLRADIDALPIQEVSQHSYKSLNDGVMHACGHDGHTAMLLGAAMVLNQVRECLNGSVRFVFQPAEEGLCGGRRLVEAGVLKNPEPNIVFGFHGWPGYKTGYFISKPGPMTSACDTFTIKILGKGGHSSAPELGIDPILISAKIIEAFNSIQTKFFSPLESVLVSVCKVVSGTTSNVIPESAEMEGSARYFNMAHGHKIQKIMKKIVRNMCKMYGATYEFDYNFLYIPTINNRSAVEFAEKTCAKYFSKNNYITRDKPVMGAEDFSFFIKSYPGAFINIGLGEEVPNLHTNTFDFNDDVIVHGVMMFCALVLEYIGKD